MPWEEREPKVFSRPIGENETFIKLVGDAGHPLNREHWAINSTATIDPTGLLRSADLADTIRRAWGHLRFQQPSIAAEVAPDNDHFIYRVPQNGAELNDWLSKSYYVESSAKSSADVIISMKPTPFATLTYIPGSAELLVHTAHWRSDGIGVVMLLHALLELIASPSLSDPTELAWETEVARLAPAVEEAASMPTVPSPEQKEKATEMTGTFAHVASAIGITYNGDASTLPAGTRSANIKLDSRTTEKVVAACKEHKATVTAAVHASVAGANYVLADKASKGKHYTSTIRFGLRPYLPEKYSTSAYGAALYTSGWIKKVEAGSSWDDRFHDYQQEYLKGYGDSMQSHRECAKQLCELIRNFPQGGDPPSGVDISSIGVAEKFVRRSYGDSECGVEVRSVSVGVEILTREAVCFVWTFRDELNLSIVYNESFHSQVQMDLFAQIVKKLLLQGLGVADAAS